VDYSGRFINTAMSLQSGEEVEYGKGEVASLRSLDGTSPEKITFKQARAILETAEKLNGRLDVLNSPDVHR